MTNAMRILAILGAALGASRAAGDVIALRPWARTPVAAPEAKPLTLADVADLTGAEAQRHAGVVLIADPAKELASGEATIDIARVRAALDAAGAHWGRLELQGKACVVRAARKPADSTPEPTRPSREPQPVDLSGPPTVRAAVVVALLDLYGVAPEDLCVEFDPEDESLLGMGTVGRRIEARPLASGASPRAPIAVTLYEGDGIIASGTVETEALLRREGVRLGKHARRGAGVNAADVEHEPVWLPPGVEPATLSEALGATLKHAVRAGETIRRDDLQSPLVVKKGDVVTVHCLSGAVAVRTPARALSDARAGETIEFRLERSKKTFRARLDGHGRATLDTGIGAEPTGVSAIDAVEPNSPGRGE